MGDGCCFFFFASTKKLKARVVCFIAKDGDAREWDGKGCRMGEWGLVVQNAFFYSLCYSSFVSSSSR